MRIPRIFRQFLRSPETVFGILSHVYYEYRYDLHRTYSKSQFASFGEGSQLAKNVTITQPKRVYIGKNSTVQRDSYIHSMGGVYIEDCVGIGMGSFLLTFVHDYFSTKTIPYDNGVFLKPVVIRSFAWLGWHTMVMPGIEIGEGAITGPGSVITKDVPPLAIVFGNPAQVVGHRPKQHFYECVREGRTNSVRTIEVFGSYCERIQPFVKARYKKELAAIGLLDSAST